MLPGKSISPTPDPGRRAAPAVAGRHGHGPLHTRRANRLQGAAGAVSGRHPDPDRPSADPGQLRPSDGHDRNRGSPESDSAADHQPDDARPDHPGARPLPRGAQGGLGREPGLPDALQHRGAGPVRREPAAALHAPAAGCVPRRLLLSECRDREEVHGAAGPALRRRERGGARQPGPGHQRLPAVAAQGRRGTPGGTGTAPRALPAVERRPPADAGADQPPGGAEQQPPAAERDRIDRGGSQPQARRRAPPRRSPAGEPGARQPAIPHRDRQSGDRGAQRAAAPDGGGERPGAAAAAPQAGAPGHHPAAAIHRGLEGEGRSRERCRARADHLAGAHADARRAQPP